MKKILVIAAISMMGMMAKAADARPLWVCNLAFAGESKGLQLIVGHFSTVATGELNCTDAFGGVYSRDVKITMGTKIIGPAVGIGHFHLVGESAEISLFNETPDVIFGNYVVAQGEVALVGGAAAFTAVRVSTPEIAVNVSLQLLRGWGAQLGFHKMTIEPLN